MIKLKVRERDGYACTACGMSEADHIERTGRVLDVHRLVPGSDYTMAGCVTLCRPCHGPQPRLPQGQGKPRPLPILHVQVESELRRAMDDHIAAFNGKNDSKVSIRSTTECALKAYLREKGFWPRKKKGAARARKAGV